MARIRYNRDFIPIGAGADALNLRISIDVVDFPYANDAVSTLDTTTLTPLGFEIGSYKQSLSTNGTPDEANVENISVKVYDKSVRTTVTTGANSATQTVGDTTGMIAGMPLRFATANVDRVIDHIASGTSVVLTASVSTTTGEVVSQAGIMRGILNSGIPNTKRLQFILWDEESSTYQPKYFVIDKASIAPEIKTVTFKGTNYDSVISFNAVSLLKMVLQEEVASNDEAIAITIATSDSVQPTSGHFNILVTTTLGTETTANIAYNASTSAVLSALQALPLHGKYFVSCFSVNGSAPNNPPDQINTTQTVFIFTINVNQLNIDHGISWLYSGWSTDTSPAANIYISATVLNNGANAAMSKNNGQYGSTYPSNLPSIPQNVTELSSLDYLIRTRAGGSLYQTPSNIWAPYFFWYAEQSNLWSGAPYYTNVQSLFVSFHDLLLVICYIVRQATDITATELVSVNLDHLGVRASKPGAVPAASSVSYGVTYEVGTSHLAQAMALHIGFIRPLSVNIPEYCLASQGSLYDALKILCDSVVCLPYCTYGASTGVTLTLKSPLSPTYADLVSGNPEIVPVGRTLKSKMCAFQNDSANCGMKRPTGLSAAIQNDDSSPNGDLFQTEYLAPSSVNGSGIGGQTIFGTFWNNWTPAGTSGGNIPWLENSLEIFGTSSGGNTDVFGADYSMYDFPNTGDPFIGNYGFVVTQGFGGGTLQGGAVVTLKTAHYQQAIALGLFSLYCEAQNSELIEFECQLTLAMIIILRQNPIFTRIKLRTDALYNFLVIGIDYNIFDSKRTVKITAIRNR